MEKEKTFWSSFKDSSIDWTVTVSGENILPRNVTRDPKLLSLPGCPFEESTWYGNRFQLKAAKDVAACVDDVFDNSPPLSKARYNPKPIDESKQLFPLTPHPKKLPVPPGGFYSLDEKLTTIYQRSSCGYYQVDVAPNTQKRARALLQLDILRRSLLDTQQNYPDEADLSIVFTYAKKLYEDIVSEHGRVKGWRDCRVDPRYFGIRSAFEDDKGNPTEFLTKRVRWCSRLPDFKSIVHAAQVCIGYKLRVDVDWIVEHAPQWDRQEIINTLLDESFVFPHWNGDEWQLVDMDDYVKLHTNIREADRLLDENKDRLIAAYSEAQYQRCKAAIREAFPLPLMPPTMDVAIKRQAAIDAGADFDNFDDRQRTAVLAKGREIQLELNHFLLEPAYFVQYFDERFGATATVDRVMSKNGGQRLKVRVSSCLNETPSGMPRSPRFSGVEVFKRMVRGHSPKYTEKVMTPDGVKSIEDKEESAALVEAYKVWKADFFKWLWSDEKRSLAIAYRFNQEINTVPVVKMRGEWMLDENGGFPETTKPKWMKYHPYQPDGVYQFLRYKRMLLALGCGAGKTRMALDSCLLSKARGLANKPAFCVLKATKASMIKEARAAAPWARIFYLREEDKGNARHEKLMSLLHGEFDLVILTHHEMDMIPLGEEGIQASFGTLIRELEWRLEDSTDRSEWKTIAAQIKSLEEKMLKMRDQAEKVPYRFEDFGFDLLIYDEFHEWGRHPGMSTRYSTVKGIVTRSAAQAVRTMHRIHYMIDKGYRVGAMTATPIVNSLVEMCTLMRYFIPDVLAQHGLSDVDDWIETFCQISADNVFTSGGKMAVKEEARNFVNIDMMLSLMREFMLLVPVSEQNRILKDRPDIRSVTIASPPTLGQAQFYSEIAKRVDAIVAGTPKEIPSRKMVINEKGEKVVGTVMTEDNHLTVYNHMRHAGLAAQVCCGSYGIDEPFSIESKVFQCARNIYFIRNLLARFNVPGHQLVFLDLSTKKPGIFSVYELLQNTLELMGLRVAVVHDLKNPQVELTQIALEKTADVIMISTKKGSTGVDHLQEGCIAGHHLDVPRIPSALEQRTGRFKRIGNLFPIAFEFFYVTQGANGNAGVDTLSLQACLTRLIAYVNLMGGINPGDSLHDIGGKIILDLEVLKGVATGDPTYSRLSFVKKRLVEMESDQASQLLAVSKNLSERKNADAKIAFNQEYLEKVKPFRKKIEGLRAIDIPLPNGKALRLEEQADKTLKPFLVSNGEATPTERGASTSFLIEIQETKLKKTNQKQGEILLFKTAGFEVKAIIAVPPGGLFPQAIGYTMSYPETEFTASLSGLMASAVFNTITKRIPEAIKNAEKELAYYQNVKASPPVEMNFDDDEYQALQRELKDLTKLIKSLDNLKQKRLLLVEKAADFGFSEQQIQDIERALELAQKGGLQSAKALLDGALTVYKLNEFTGEPERVTIEEITEISKEEVSTDGLNLVPVDKISCEPSLEFIKQLMETPYTDPEVDGVPQPWLSEMEAMLENFTNNQKQLEADQDGTT